MTVISVTDLSLSFGTRKILDRVSFSLAENDKLGIIGVNGCGKSTLFKTITGELEPDEGQIFLSREKTVGILTQDSAFTVDETLGDNALEQMYGAFPELLAAERELAELEQKMQAGADLSLAKTYDERHNGFIRDGGLEFRSRCASILAKMGFDDESMRRPLSTLSGGQRTRLALARQLCREPDILLLDEPTNHLDIASREWIEEAVEAYEGTLLFVSHDRYFINRFATRVWELENGVITDYPVPFQRYKEIKEREKLLAQTQVKPEKREEKSQQKAAPKGGKAQQAARKQLTICERDMAKLEAEIAKLDEELEANACDYEKYGALYAKKEELDEQLLALMERWEQLTLEAEGQA